MAFEEIYRIYWQKIFRVCMGYVNDPEWAKDITQETFFTVLQQLPKFRNESAIGTWIFRIASNHCLRQIEKQNRMPKTELPVQMEERNHDNDEHRMQFLYRCISELPETDRIIISLELEDVRQAEIAKIVGLSDVNIRGRIFRIKEKLTEKFKKYEQR